jgi:hypothetical protein
MPNEFLADFESALVGCACAIVRRECDWYVAFGDNLEIALSIPWRIVSEGRIAFGNQDHGQRFALPSPINGEERARELLQDRRIVSASIDRLTADLTIVFDNGTRLDAFNNSAGYEGWQAHFKHAGKRASLIALGGGEVVACADE